MNQAHYKKVLAQIEAHPETWNQKMWHCGTTHCFAGWAQVLSGKQANEDTARRDARVYLDLSIYEADYLFDPCRSLDDLKAGYDRDGYNRDGYNRAGYDRDGLDINNRPKEAP
ncbi:MAG: hypothetical protein ACRCZI_15765 [Cetobacterium sp.]